MTPYLKTYEKFYPKARGLRAQFDQVYKDPRQAHSRRFVWDFWHVENHYHHLRTPAQNFFDPKSFEHFYTHLVEWGRKHLGCHDISPPWLSLYPEGSYQNLHVDEPHGPFAWVYSLTLDPKKFRGGRTVIGKDKIWGAETEWNLSVEKLKRKISVEPKFNRLIVFDPSYPHGVSRVSGVEEPGQMRLVLHGWFVQPRPFWYGPLTAQEVKKSLDEFFKREEINQIFDQFGPGYLGLRLRISKAGRVKNAQILAHTTSHSAKAERRLIQSINKIYFSKRSKEVELTFPVVLS